MSTMISSAGSGGSSLSSGSVGSKGAELDKLSKEVEKQQDFLQKVLFALAENQIPGQESDQALNSAAISQLVAGASAAQMGKKTFELLMEVAEQLKNAGITSYSNLVGQRVSIDDSIRSYSGNKVHFEYTIHGNKPNNAVLQAEISILNQNGEKVFKKTIKNPSVGKNVFEWEGVDKDGEKVQAGDYHMEVEASYTLPGQLPVPMHTDSIREGTVEAIDFDQEQRPFYIIDGERIDATSVRQFLGRTGDTGSSGTSRTKANDLKDYIGDIVDVKQEKVTFTGQKTDLTFFSTVQDPKATIRVNVYDAKDKLVAVDEVKDVHVTQGQNVLEWLGLQSTKQDDIDQMKGDKLKPIYLAHGTYRYEISLVSADSDGKETVKKLENKGRYEIAAVDTTGKVPMLVSKEGYKFQLGDVTRTEKHVEVKSHMQLLEDAGLYLGKTIKMKNDEIEYDGSPLSRKFYISPPATSGWKVDNVTMHIIDKVGNLVRNITKTGAEAYYETETEVPDFDKLDFVSQQKINNAAQQNFGSTYQAIHTRATTTPDLDAQNQLKLLDEGIEKGFRQGELFEDGPSGYNSGTLTDAQKEAIKDRNMGLLKLEWDGKNDKGESVPKGTYTISVTYYEVDGTGAVQGTHKTLELATIKTVKWGDVSNGSLRLICDDGTKLSESDLKKIDYIGIS